MSESPPDPYWLAEQILAGEHVNGWTTAARMLAEALVDARVTASPDRIALQRLRNVAEALNERIVDTGDNRFVFAHGSRDAIYEFRSELFNREERHGNQEGSAAA